MRYASELENIETVPTGTFLDKLIPGLPKGKIIEIFGDEKVGKSTLCMQIVVSAQRQGLKCLWADVEYSYEAPYAKLLGVDNSKVGMIRTECAEDVLNSVDEEISSRKWDVVVLDSVGGLTPRAEIEKGVEGKVIGGQASLVARFCRKIVPTLAVTGTMLIVINHSFLDVMSGRLLTSGGRKLGYHKSLSIRLKVKPNMVLKVGERKVGRVMSASIFKDKCFGKDEMEVDGQLLFGAGFSASADRFEELLTTGEISKVGNTYTYKGEKLGVGKLKAQEALKALL